MDKNFKLVLMLSLAFSLVFFGFNTAQSMIVPLLGDVGANSLFVLYLCLAFGTFISPAFVNHFEDLATPLLLSSITYTLFILSFVYISEAATYIFSALLGFGAAILWTAQGTFLTLCSTSGNRGKLAGIFFAIQNIGTIAGNISGSLLLSTLPPVPKSKVIVTGFNGANSWLFLCLGIVSLVGSLVFICLRGEKSTSANSKKMVNLSQGAIYALETESLVNLSATVDRDAAPVSPSKTKAPPPSKVAKLSPLDFIKQTLTLLLAPKMVCFLPLFFYIGINNAFAGSQFSRQIDDATIIGYSSAVISGSAVCGSIASGYMADRVGRNAVFMLATMCQVLAYVTIWYANKYQGGLIFLSSTLLGFSDSSFRTLSYPLLASEFGVGSVEISFAVQKLMTSLGATAAFKYTPLFASPGQKSTDEQLMYEIIISCTLLGVSVLGYFMSLRITYPVKD